ncbi:MAG TPA: peptidase M14, partial [Pricia sp.]|nr:peptidase M14 [Pricia sp.]
MTLKFFIFALLAVTFCNAQQGDITESLYETYDKYREASLDKRRIKHRDLQPLVSEYRGNPKFKVQTVGRSI